MNELKYVPQACQGESPLMTGSVTLKVPTFDERYAFLEEVGIEFNEKGEIKMAAGSLSVLRKMVKASEKFYVKVELQKGEVKFNSFSEMQTDPAFDQVLIEIAGMVRSGFVPEKN